MRVLGLNSYFHCSSAGLIEDGIVRCAVKEERLVRRKFSREFPFRSIAWCLENAGVSMGEIDWIAFPVDLAVYLEHLNPAQIGSLRYRGELGYAVADALISMTGSAPSASGFTQSWKVGDTPQKLRFVNHHLSHAAQAFFLSPFEESAILVMDAFGEKACQLMAMGRGNRIQPLGWNEFPHSVGCFYATMTEFLGFRPNDEEWKVMGASSYGNPDRFYEILSRLISVDGAKVELDLSYFNFFQFHRPAWFSPKMTSLLGQPRRRGDEIQQVHFDLAAAAQKVTEETIFRLAAWLRKETGCPNLCLGGGVFQNSVLNGKVKARTGFDGLYVPSAPDDSGGSLGSALYCLHHEQGAPRSGVFQQNYWGPSFDDDTVRKALAVAKWPCHRLANPAKAGAAILSRDHILGWFQGGMEFGDRALGNRSILGNPRNPAMKDLINASVKFREEFRPFAPSILAERVGEYFVGAEATPFMEKVYPIRPEKRGEIPAVTHVDGSGRLQTVTRDQNARYHELIVEFQRLTGTPVVLNTSFNINNEPIVAAPSDALRTFACCGMDFLIVGDYLVAKDPLQARPFLEIQ